MSVVAAGALPDHSTLRPGGHSRHVHVNIDLLPGTPGAVLYDVMTKAKLFVLLHA